VEVAAGRKYIVAFQGRDFHLPHASRFFEVFCASGIMFPCVFKGLEEYREVGGERMSVAFWHTSRLPRLIVRYMHSLATTPLAPPRATFCSFRWRALWDNGCRPLALQKSTWPTC